ncbi:MAG: biotin carboxylase N-terminal domain-containing protein, partial [Actinomycetota bacterium]
MGTIAKLLVANRGEVAVRILRACREMGIATVAIFSEIDREALHVAFADEAYLVGETPPVLSYMNIGRILEIAKRSRSDAIHPGYGFLSESPRFARAVLEAGFVWVGPPPAALEAVGDKTAARLTAAGAGVVPVPGSFDPVPDAGGIAAFAAVHGWPVALKAAHGGGGRGFR